MPEATCVNRLTVLGGKAKTNAFSRSAWEISAGAKHVELLEDSPGRVAWQFETTARPPLLWLVQVSRHWPTLVFLLHYENEGERSTGLAKAKDGAVEHYRISY